MDGAEEEPRAGGGVGADGVEDDGGQVEEAGEGVMQVGVGGRIGKGGRAIKAEVVPANGVEDEEGGVQDVDVELIIALWGARCQNCLLTLPRLLARRLW